MIPPAIHLLVVDDDLVACTRHQHYFEAQGYRVSVAHDGMQMWCIMDVDAPAAVLLDVALPGKDGLELARELRARDEHLGIIFVTARDDDVDKIVGLESGANDYVTKPFNSRELLARVKIVLRDTWHRRPVDQGRQRSFGRWRLNLAQRSLYDEHGERYMLTQGEMSVLAALADRPGTVLSRSQLLHHLSERPSETSVRSVDVLISRLRRKLEDYPGHPALIVTARGQGYVLMGVRQ
jgi:two-component system torCAD operon response regulator TorR